MLPRSCPAARRASTPQWCASANWSSCWYSLATGRVAYGGSSARSRARIPTQRATSGALTNG
eukprot:1924978-Prymnesium_polylepis.1